MAETSHDITRAEPGTPALLARPPEAPPADETPATVRIVDLAHPDERATTVFLAWEKLRLLYNAILAAVVCWVGSGLLAHSAFWPQLLMDAFLANVFFCLGPCLEGYICLFGGNGTPRATVRAVLFFLGTLLSVVLALGALFSMSVAVFVKD
jgi:hypothetical protein